MSVPSVFTNLVDSLDNVLVVVNNDIVYSSVDSSVLEFVVVDEINYDNREIIKPLTINKKSTDLIEVNVLYYFDQYMVLNKVFKIDMYSNLKVNEYLVNGSDEKVFLNNFYILDETSNLEVNVFNDFNKGSLVVDTRGYVSKYANLTVVNGEVSDVNVISNTEVSLLEEEARSTVKTVALTSSKQVSTFRQFVSSDYKYTKGFIENYGVSADESSLTFDGIGNIRKGCNGSEARQSNKGIILGKKARLEANPLLLIDEYDVEASHGAAIGKMDEEQLYYLMSRGISYSDASKLIINGYLTPIVKVLPESLQNRLLEVIESKIN